MLTPIGRERKLLSNLREDNWWISPMLVLFGLLSFIFYSTWAAWQGEYFWWSGVVNAEGFGGYLSPFYSPPIFIKEGMAGPIIRATEYSTLVFAVSAGEV